MRPGHAAAQHRRASGRIERNALVHASDRIAIE